ncbi:MAG: oligosaccharide flippase family protein [Chloroflexaceae bacterium]|nr:oligosaccharide flippase family protein [Chloroflexaceae bacterium]
MTSTTQPPSSGTPGTPGASGSLGRQVSRAMAWNTLTAPLKTAVELATNLIILNVLTLPQFGVLRLVTSAAATLGIWVDLGIDRALPRFIPELQQERGQAAVRRFMQIIFLVKALLLTLMSGLFLLFSERFVAFLLDGVAQLPERIDAAAQLALTNEMLRLAPLMVGAVLALVILGSLYDGLMAYLVSYFRQRAWNLITIMGDIVQPTLTAVLVLAGYGIGGVLVAIVATPVLSVLVAGWQVLSSLGSAPTPAASTAAPAPPEDAPANNTLWRRFAVYTGMSNVLNLSDYFLSWLFAVFLLTNPVQVAIFSVGSALVRQTLALLYRPLVGIQVPLFTRVRGGDAPLPDAYAAVLRILALIMLPGGVGLVLLANELILVQYPQYVAATLVIAILTPALFFESFLSSAQIILQVYERYGLLILSRLAALPVIVVMVGMWLTGVRVGLLEAALLVGGGRILMGLTAALLAQRAFGLRYVVGPSSGG